MTGSNLVTVAGTCNRDGHSTRGFANLQFRKVRGGIEIDPHVTGACVITCPWDQVPKLLEWFGELTTA